MCQRNRVRNPLTFFSFVPISKDTHKAKQTLLKPNQKYKENEETTPIEIRTPNVFLSHFLKLYTARGSVEHQAAD